MDREYIERMMLQNSHKKRFLITLWQMSGCSPAVAGNGLLITMNYELWTGH